MPETLLGQLRDGGRLVAVVGRTPAGRATVFTRSGDETSPRVAFDANLPPLPGFAIEPSFEL